MPFSCTKPIPGVITKITQTPWVLAQKPFQVAPRTYYVSGQAWVGAYLIDTHEGLILIDTAVSESLYLLIDSIYQLGFDPHDITKILLSHAHVDHIGGAAELAQLTGADLYMSKLDYEFMQACPNETIALDERMAAHPFEVSHFYENEPVIEQGDIRVKTVLTPGHTIGCTSFLWDVVNPATGETLTCGMHGGVGANTMNDAYYKTSGYLTPDLRARFIADLDAVGKLHVDIALPSHPNQITITDRAGTYTHTSQPFVDASVWHDFLAERVRQVREYDESAIKAMMK